MSNIAFPLHAHTLTPPPRPHAPAGAQRVILPKASATADPGGLAPHAAVLRAACAAGCRVDARDIAGYTALAHSTGHHPRLDLAAILLEYGADPGQRDRFGTVPLHHAAMANETEAFKMLLE